MVFCECPDSKSIVESVYGNQGGFTPCLGCEDWQGLGRQEQCHHQVALELGDRCWLGENCWIDNLDKVVIGSNVCISQGVLLLTGNHDYTISSMPYRNAPIKIEDGAWVGAKTTICPGVTVHRNAILTVGSVATKDMQQNGIYQGNPAVKIRERKIKN